MIVRRPLADRELLDYGPAKVLAVDITAAGERVSLGFRPTRRDAMRAILPGTVADSNLPRPRE
jgi:hypothetical protein